MKFSLIAALFAAVAVAHYDSSSAAAEPSEPCDEEPAYPSVTAKPSAPVKVNNETCDVYTETCTYTVTAKKTWAANVTAPIAAGTGTPATPTKAYYSNAANSLAGGALVGAGAIAALFL